MPLHKPPPVPLLSPDVVDATYENLDNGTLRTSADDISNGSTLPPPYPAPVLARNSTGHEVLYHILDGALEDSSLQYKHPTLQKLGVGLLYTIIIFFVDIYIIYFFRNMVQSSRKEFWSQLVTTYQGR